MVDAFLDFDWDAGNREKCQQHGVTTATIEKLFGANALRVEPDILNSSAEQRYRAIGKTAAGRAVFLVFTFRDYGNGNLIRPISARYMHRKELDSYEKENP